MSDYLIFKNLTSIKGIDISIRKIFESYAYLLPKKRSASIFLKPNFNSDMIALTGNTTDFRIIVSLVRELQRRGYTNIILGDGTSSGFYNAGIDVLKRLGVKELAKKLSIKVVDLNFLPSRLVRLGGTRVKIAKICLDCDFFINIPKIKTHAEAGLSCCMKNLIGCVSGSLEKQKIHENLFKNIVLLNKLIIPDLNIIDGLISMEGTGPSAGKPVSTNLLISGVNSNFLDFIVSRMFVINAPYVENLGFNVKKLRGFEPPTPSFLFRLINGRLRPFFKYLRYSPLIFNLLSNKSVSSVMKFIGARQDLFNKLDSFVTLKSKISSKKVIPSCPLGYNYSDVSRCSVKCLYCCFADSNVVIEGQKGYLSYQFSKD